jgi:release factor glutamine methyltransferase
VAQATTLLGEVGQAAELLVGDLWTPLAGRRFDLIVANPPQFATIAPAYAGRPPTWSQGGPDGRGVMDPLLRGLRRHLAPGGHAILVQNAFLGMAATAQLLAEQGLAMRRVASALMPLAPEKRAVMTPAIRDGAGPDAVRRLGNHTFIAADILDISSNADAGG